MALYFGKFSDKFPDQFEDRNYHAGAEGNDWYGGIKPEDYVFPIYQGKVSRLWQVKEYTTINLRTGEPRGAVTFNEIKILPKALRLSDEFIRYKYFNLDLNLVNKSAKLVKNCGFFPISTTPNCPVPDAIEFSLNNLRDIYICLHNAKVQYKENDIRVKIGNLDEYPIDGIEIFNSGQFNDYEPLLRLYKQRNPEDERYTLKELISYAVEDSAPNKKAYLGAVINELSSNGYYKELSPIRLYDNILVGRKRSADTPKGGDSKVLGAIASEQDDDEEPDLSQFEKYADLLDFDPNLILYGPPGTGKTYSAMKIIECFDKKFSRDYKSFCEIDNEERVRFVTFHQSYSYEEFIEGIRPQLDLIEDQEANTTSNIGYRIEDGILKKLADAAATQKRKTEFAKPDILENVSERSRVWKISLGRRNNDTIYNQCIKDEEIALGWLEDNDLKGMDYNELRKLMEDYFTKNGYKENPSKATSITDAMVNGMSIGDLVMVFNSPYSVRAIGVIVGDYFYSEKYKDSYPHRRKVKWLKICKNNEEINIYELNGEVRLAEPAIYQLMR